MRREGPAVKNMIRENGIEALTGLLVVLLAAWFVWFAYDRTGGGGSAGAVRVTAIFPNASGIGVGTDVRVAGLKVGTVAAQRLDPQSYQVDVILALDPAIRLPKDSSAAVTSEGLLGSTFIALIPGGETAPLKSGDTIIDTQGSVDMMGLIGQFINKSGDDAPAGGGTGTMEPRPGDAPAAAKP